jgi:hypothetical protein
MAAENFQARDDFGQVQGVKHYTTSSGNITYTAKTGRGGAADNFAIDRVIRVTTTSTYSLTITVPNGVYYGQKLTILFETKGGTDTVTVNASTGDNGTTLTAAGGYNHFEWHGPTLGWCLTDSSAT